MTVAECLKQARDLIADPERWTQHANARDKAGKLVNPRDNTAVAWDASGAIRRMAGPDWEASIDALLVMVKKLYGCEELIFVDDYLGHAASLAAFDAAIAEEES